jgi:hypothetical protein
VNQIQKQNVVTTKEDLSQAPHGGKPATRARIVEKIRSELNIEKWPAIWQPAKSKNRPALRTMERETLAEDGSRVVSRVEVGYTQLGTLSTEEQKLLYVLIKLWEDAGKPDVQVFFSTRGLARMLKKKGWGTNVIQSLTKSLRKLRTIPIEWINSYFDQTANGAVVVDRRPFTILGDLRIVERRQDGAVNSSLGYFKFDDHILSNLLRNYTKPVCIEEFFKLKSEIAQLIYTHIDLLLFDKSKYERRTQELFNDLGLKNHEYSHMYERKRALERALGELQGIRLSSGILKSAVIEKTKDGKDYKVVFQKASRSDVAVEQLGESPSAMEGDAVVINNYSTQKDPAMVQAEELVRYFHKVFHGVDEHTPQSKETGQALSLISQHGFEAAKGVVNFAHEEALRTKFSAQHFGAVLSYTSRALAHATRESEVRVSAKPQVPVAPSPSPVQSEELARGERRLSGLTTEQSAVRFERLKAEMMIQNPFLARHWKTGGQGQEKMVRARLVRELANEPMDLMII